MSGLFILRSVYSELHKFWDEVKKGTPKMEACRKKRDALQKEAVKSKI